MSEHIIPTVRAEQPQPPNGFCLACRGMVPAKTARYRPRKDSRFCSKRCRDGWLRTQDPSSRFWDKVSKDGPIHPVCGQCWMWTKSVRYGYGIFGLRRGVQVVTHRYSWELHNGPIPEGLCVLHHCDNRACVNPTHLFLGDLMANMADMTSKGRQVCGERQHSAKLGAGQVLQIRRRFVRGSKTDGTDALAREFCVTRATIIDAVRRVTWKHI